MTSTIKWNFLPKLPNHDNDILIAIKYTQVPIQGYYLKNNREKHRWQVSYQVTDEMCDGFCHDRTIAAPELVYAWAELPKLPPVPDNLNESKKEFTDLNESVKKLFESKKEVKYFLVTDKSGRSMKSIKLTEEQIRKRFDFDELNQEIDKDEIEDDGIDEFLNSCYIGDVWETRTIKIKCDKIK